jgi:hypothetical protein
MKLHNKELHNLHTIPNIIRILNQGIWAGAKRNTCRILVEKPEGKRQVRRPICRWVYNIKMDLRKIGWGGMDWIDLGQDRDQWRAIVNTVMNL